MRWDMNTPFRSKESEPVRGFKENWRTFNHAKSKNDGEKTN
jgi:hypothetical protein